MRVGRWLSIIFLLSITMLTSYTTTVEAHAYLEESVPAREAELEESLTEIRLKFSEGIDANLSSILLMDGMGNEIEGVSRGEEDVWLILEHSPLEAGLYQVKWQVLSLDTHITDGSFRFSVGMELPREGPAETITLDPSTTEETDSSTGETEQPVREIIEEEDSSTKGSLLQIKKILRVIEMLFVLSMAGLFFFAMVIWRDAPGQLEGSSRDLQKLLHTAYIAGVILLVLTGSMSILNYASQLHLGQWGDPSYWGIVNQVILHTWIGQAAILKPLLFLLLFAIAKFRERLIFMPASLFVLLFLIFSWTSHANAFNMLFSHTIHLLMAAIWLGGLIGFSYVSLKPIQERTELLYIHSKLKIFSAIALWVAIAVVFSGLLLGTVNLGAVAQLWQSSYGITLSIKIILVVLLLGLAVYHRFIWLPRLQAASNPTRSSATAPEANQVSIKGLLGSLRAELCLAWLIIMVASVLSSTPLPN